MISVIDDDEAVRNSIKRLLNSAGYETAVFASAELFLESARISETECIILDLNMPGTDGLELQTHLNELRPEVPIIFISACVDPLGADRARQAGAVGFLTKPYDSTTLIATIENALTRFRSLRKDGRVRRDAVD
jgi:FixJ family two-component response regulator